MTITLQEPILTLAQQQAAEGGYPTVAAYLESLVERADVRRETQTALREGLADVAAGRVRPAREALAELAKKHNSPTHAACR